MALNGLNNGITSRRDSPKEAEWPMFLDSQGVSYHGNAFRGLSIVRGKDIFFGELPGGKAGSGGPEGNGVVPPSSFPLGQRSFAHHFDDYAMPRPT